MQKIIRTFFIILILLAVAYFVLPFVWSAIKIGVKYLVFELLVDYGLYVFLILGSGGYLWWKLRKWKNREGSVKEL